MSWATAMLALVVAVCTGLLSFFAGRDKDVGYKRDVAENGKKHIVYVVCDDCGWADVGYHGSDFPSPNLDKLARNGIRLDRFYTQETCSPTRSTLMTGRYPFHTGSQKACYPGTDDHLPLKFRTMGQLLSEEGYSTHYIGKWHLGYASYKYFPTNRGFDSFVGFMQPHNTVYSHRFGDPAKVDGFDFWNNTELFREVDGVHSNNVFLKELDRVVGKAAESDKASFVIFAPASIHMPLEHPPANYSACENVASGSRRTLCNMMGNFDETVGGVVETYKKGGIWDDTLMVFLSDNGGSVPGVVGESFHAADSSNFPLRAGKGTLFEGGVRSLGFVQGGKTVIPEHARGSIKTDLIHVADLLPTAFAAANSRELPADVDGVNQWPSLTGSSGGPRTELPINIQPEASSIIVGQWKLIVGTPLYDGLWTVSPYVRIEPPTHGAADGDDFLFNIFDDPTEQFNVARDYPSVVADLKDRIASYVNSPSYMDPSDNGKNDVPREALPIFNGDAWLPFLDDVVVS